MTEKEFEEIYCRLCGTQRCGGVFDEEMREGCAYYQKVMLGKQTLRELLEEINTVYRNSKQE